VSFLGFFNVRGILLLAVLIGAIYAGGMTAHHHNPDVFQQLYMHLSPSAILWHGEPLAIHAPWLPSIFTMNSAGENTHELVFTNLQVFQIAAVLVILIAFSGVASHLRTGKGDTWSRMLAGFALYIRDDMVYPVMGEHDGKRFTPYFLCVFFFVLFMNLFGLVPHAATATASIAVTCALALTTFAAMLGCGMIAQGPIAFWIHLVPVHFSLKPAQLALWLLLLVVELMGLLVKPFALMIRLFANMTAGHLIVLSCMGLIMFFAGGAMQSNAVAGWGSSPLAVGFAVFVMIIETFVAFLQAYIFTTLSIMFVGAAVHPEH
jgi:F-type H+-transporting ATPase subunit a